MKPKVAVLGAGAMGSLFGGTLAEGGLDATLIDIWRDHVDAINDGGLFRDDTVAISFQNGLGNEETIAGVLGAERVLGGVTAQGASIEGPGRIRSYADLPSRIGELQGGVSERATAIAHAFSEHGLETTPSDHIRHDIWKKLMVNVGVSAMSGVTNLTIGAAVAIPELRRMCYGAVAEAVPVAQADGVALSHDEVAKCWTWSSVRAAPVATSRACASTCSSAARPRSTSSTAPWSPAESATGSRLRSTPRWWRW